MDTEIKTMGEFADEELFLPNNHSAFEIHFVDVKDDKKKEVVDVLQEYAISTIATVEQVDAWEKMSNNFRVTLTDGVRLLLRKNIHTKDVVRIEFVTKLIAFLRSKNILVPDIIHAQNGQPYVGKNGYIWQLFSYVEGDYFQGSEEELKEIAKCLASFHIAMSEVPLEISKEHPNNWTIEELRGFFDQACMQTSSLDINICAHREHVLQQAEKTKQIQVRAEIRRQPIHRDLHPHNTIFREEILRVLLDFDDVSYSELARDVANALHRFVRQYSVHEERDKRETLTAGVHIFLDNYQSVNPLNKNEIQMLGIYMQDELIGKIVRILRMYYVYNDSTLTEGGNLEKMFTLLKEATYIENIIQTYGNS